MILFYDTETSGFVDEKMPRDHECQPHLVQLACLLTDDFGREYSTFNVVVDVPPRFEIPAGASNVHGITTSVAHDFGMYPTPVNYMWDRMAQMADKIVCHNTKFDRAVMDISFRRRPPFAAKADNYDMTLDGRHGMKEWVCTMEMASPILKLPPTNRMLAVGMNKPKAPKLEECIKFFFNEELSGAHDALVDVRACARIYFHMKQMELAA